MRLTRRSRTLTAVVIASAATPGTVLAQRPDSLPAAPGAPGRVVGVFDSESGHPIEGAHILDLASGRVIETSRTGTARLWAIDSGTLIRIGKLGYLPQTQAVEVSRADTTPITVVLVSYAQELPRVVTTAHHNERGPGDTVRILELRGFYDRKTYSGAPQRNFVTADQLKWFHSLADIQFVTGHPLCTSNLYLDGVRIGNLAPMPAPPPAKDGTRPFGKGLPAPSILENIPIEAVLAVEQYAHAGEVPPAYNATHDPHDRGECVTLVWTR